MCVEGEGETESGSGEEHVPGGPAELSQPGGRGEHSTCITCTVHIGMADGPGLLRARGLLNHVDPTLHV